MDLSFGFWLFAWELPTTKLLFFFSLCPPEVPEHLVELPSDAPPPLAKRLVC